MCRKQNSDSVGVCSGVQLVGCTNLQRQDCSYCCWPVTSLHLTISQRISGTLTYPSSVCVLWILGRPPCRGERLGQIHTSPAAQPRPTPSHEQATNQEQPHSRRQAGYNAIFCPDSVTTHTTWDGHFFVSNHCLCSRPWKSGCVVGGWILSALGDVGSRSDAQGGEPSLVHTWQNGSFQPSDKPENQRMRNREQLLLSV